MAGCAFFNEDQKIPTSQDKEDACRARKQHAIEVIRATKPDVVIISNWTGWLGPNQWGESIRQVIAKFRDSVDRVAWLSPPPGNIDFRECYGSRASVPADCVSSVSTEWLLVADDVTKAAGAQWIDPQPWFCSAEGLCPAFVGSTPTKHDKGHVFRAYAKAIPPVMLESMATAGLLNP